MRQEVSLAWLCALPGVRRTQLDVSRQIMLPDTSASDTPCLRTDSRLCRPGDLFVALRGGRDGHAFVPDLLRRGVVCAVDTGWFLEQPESLKSSEGLVVVEDTREWLARAASRIAGLEQAELCVHGITGTNGKTSTAWVLQQLLAPIDPLAGLVGTICSRIGAGESRPAALTTPDAPWLAAFARELLDVGGRQLVMEVSSHAIQQRREAVFGFRSAVFLNLSPEHLDYHGNMESYFRVKSSFMRRPELELRLVDIDSAWGERLAKELDPLPVTTMGRAAGADWRVTQERVSGGGQSFVLEGGRDAGREELWIPLQGAFNVGNTSAAWIVAESLGIQRDQLRSLMKGLIPVPGRMEPVHLEGGPRVLIDYAHSPDGYEKALAAVDAMPRRRMHVLFGCGGERDRVKRPQMLRIALSHADRVWLTLDNPRREDPEQIFADMLAEQGADPRITRIDDRAVAIRTMLAESMPEDLVILLGKGHEDYQLIGGEKRHFDEREVLVAAWKEIGPK